MTGKRFQALCSLLDDESDEVAVNAIAELLADPHPALAERLAEMQESGNPLLRRRTHQLGAALNMRLRRSDFYMMLRRGDPDLIKGLFNLHLQWFDNDSHAALLERWCGMRLLAGTPEPDSPEKLMNVMLRANLAAKPDSTFRPEYYCIGAVLDEKTGSSALLCAVAKSLAADPDKYGIVKLEDEFALKCPDGRLLRPAKNWLLTGDFTGRRQEWDNARLLRYAAAMLFSAAVNSDSFRYVMTMSQAICGLTGPAAMRDFPYPYRPERRS